MLYKGHNILIYICIINDTMLDADVYIQQGNVYLICNKEFTFYLFSS